MDSPCSAPSPARWAATAAAASTAAWIAAPPRALAQGGYAAQRVFFLDEASAVAAGYRPCAVCMPQAYAAWKTARAHKRAAME